MPSEHARHWTLDPSVTQLNHGSFGACPRAVLDAQSRLRQRMERQPTLFLARELERLLDEARQALAAFLGAQAEDLAFVVNATQGVNTVLRSLNLSPGDELLVTDHEYNACANALRVTCEQTGATPVLVRIPLPIRDPQEVVHAILEKVTPRTRLALIDHVTSPTGLIFPIEKIVRRLDERGIDTLVDGAHAPGMLDLNLDALAAAYYTGNCHKWMCAPKGAAMLHVRKDRQRLIRPTSISHGANSPRTDKSRFQIEFQWTGTCDPTPWLCVPEAIRAMGAILPAGWNALRQHNNDLALRARRLLLERLGGEPIAPESMLGSMAAVSLPDAENNQPSSAGLLGDDPLPRQLWQRHRIEVPVIPWPAPPKRLLRISAQAYNHIDEYERLADALP